MSRKFSLAVAAFVSIAVSLAAGPAARQAPVAASDRTWIGNEARIETHLKRAEVTSIEDIGTGVTHPRRAHLNPAEPVASVVWKVLPPGNRSGFWESYKSEIAAYELDKLLGLHMVPPAVERTIAGETGAAIMWLASIQSVKQTGGKVPSGPIWGKSIRKMELFDNLICNKDRNAGNILIGVPGELILIDHSRAFITDKSMPWKLERVDAELWGRVTALTRDDLDRAIGAWIDRKAIDAMIERRNKMVTAIDKLVKKKGRALVIISE